MSRKYIYKLLLIALLLVTADFSNSQMNAAWKKLTNLPYPYATGYWLDLYFLRSNPNYGWVCGWQGYVIRTTDGGNSWSGTTITDPLITNLQLECVRFTSQTVGYASGSGKIFKTVNGGASWYDVTDSRAQDLWGNYFCHPDTGIVIGGGCGSPQLFFRTVNGGNSWYLFAANQANTGLTHVILYSGEGLGYATSSGRLWRTLDGGITWDIISITGAEDWQEQLANYNNTFILPYSGSCTGGGPGGMRSSTDGGITWNQYYTGQAMFGAFLLNSNRGWSCGWGESVYSTTNGGRTWKLDNCGIQAPDSLDDVWFVNDTTGWVVGSGIYKYAKPEIIAAKININGKDIFCEGESTVLSSASDYQYYIWSTGEITKSITVRTPGTYTLTTRNTTCDSVIPSTVTIRHYPKPQPQILSSKPPSICEGDSLILTVQPDYMSYIWSTNDSSKSITVKESGIYSVTVKDSNGCSNTQDILVKVNKNPEPVISYSGKYQPCVGDTISLYTDSGYREYYWYKDDDTALVATGTSSITAKSAGKYFVRVVTPDGCEGVSKPADVSFRDDTNRLEIVISGSTTNFDSAYYPEILCSFVTIRNISWKPAVIDNIFTIINVSFTVPQLQFPLTIPPRDEIKLKVCYSPNKFGREYDTLFIPDLCTPLLLPLQGFGKGNTLTGNSRCDVPINLKSRTVPRKYSFSADKPQPNPTTGIIRVPFDKYSSPSTIVPDCILYNLLGNKVADCKININSEQHLKEGIYRTGEYEFNLSDYQDGVYLVIIYDEGYKYSYPVMVISGK